jgi:Flp pilus assembly protein TadB
MQTGLYDHGRQRALEGKDVDPRTDELAVLEAHAIAIAQEAYREEFDSTRYESDRLRKAEFEKIQGERDQALLAEQYAVEDLARREDKVAQAQSGLKAPATPWVLMVAAIVVLMMSIAPTLHDFIFITMSDDILNWAMSLLCATLFGIFITWGIVGCIDATGRRTTTNTGTLVGGIVMCGGLGILRVAHAEGTGEVVFAAALTVVEVGVILLLEALASSLRAAYKEWSDHDAELNRTIELAATSKTHLERCRQRVAELNKTVTEFIRYVEERSIRRFNIEQIKSAAIEAITDGYHAGISGNRAYVLGGGREQ